MTARDRVRHALPISFGVHCVILLFSSFPSWRSAQGLRSITQEHPRGDRLFDMAGGDAWLEMATGLGDTPTQSLWILASSALLLLLLTPAMFMSWTYAIQRGPERGSLRDVLHFGFDHYKTSAVITLCVAPLAALSLVGVSYGCLAGFGLSSLRLPFSFAVAGLILGTLLGLLASLLHDLLRTAHVVTLSHTTGRLAASWQAVSAAPIWRDMFIYRSGDAALFAGALCIAAMPYSESTWESAIQMLLPQCLLLMRTILRSWWITALLRALTSPHRSPEQTK